MPQLLKSEAYLLHSRAYKESSALLTLFTETHGKVTCLARGIKKSKSKLSLAGHQFIPFVVECKIPREADGLYTLISVEPAERKHLSGTRSYILQLSLHYINELIYLLYPAAAEDAALYECYGITLAEMMEMTVESAMRGFELKLLETLGYGLELQYDSNGNVIDHAGHYIVQPRQPVLKVEQNYPGALPGKLLVNLVDNACWGKEELKVLKALTRQNIQYLLNGRELKSRKLYREYIQLLKQ